MDSAPAAADHDFGDEIAVLGAGPAGLTAAYVLGLQDVSAVVFESEGLVGGIAKTVEVDGFRFDLGGHRFFTKLEPVARLWDEMLGEEFLTRPRLSRIYFKGDYFSYPLKASQIPKRLGTVEFIRCLLSYLAAIPTRNKRADTFEEWVTKRFGKRLYDAFFRSYTEKVWGIPGSEIRSEWAAQRIRNLSLWNALLDVLHLRREQVTSLIEEFRYPRLGPGQMWEAFRDSVVDFGVPVHLQHRCIALRHDGKDVHSVVVETAAGTFEQNVAGVLSSIPLKELVLGLEPAAPAEVVEAAHRLRYRDFCVVALMTTEAQPFADNWIYLHDPGTRAGRVQNFGAWSDGLVRPGTTCLGVEYFCFEGDEIWELSEEESVDLATRELAQIGLIDPSKVFSGTRIRVPKAYPIYDGDYREAVAVIRTYLARFRNLETFGRNGLHRYNNQDHSMWTAMLATMNLLDGTAHDVWSVNTDAEYHEEGEVIEAFLQAPALDDVLRRKENARASDRALASHGNPGAATA